MKTRGHEAFPDKIKMNIKALFGANLLPCAIFFVNWRFMPHFLSSLNHLINHALAFSQRYLEEPSKLKETYLLSLEVFTSRHRIGVKATVLAYTPEDQSV